MGLTREGIARGVKRVGMVNLDEEDGPCAKERGFPEGGFPERVKSSKSMKNEN